MDATCPPQLLYNMLHAHKSSWVCTTVPSVCFRAPPGALHVPGFATLPPGRKSIHAASGAPRGTDRRARCEPADMHNTHTHVHDTAALRPSAFALHLMHPTLDPSRSVMPRRSLRYQALVVEPESWRQKRIRERIIEPVRRVLRTTQGSHARCPAIDSPACDLQKQPARVEGGLGEWGGSDRLTVRIDRCPRRPALHPSVRWEPPTLACEQVDEEPLGPLLV
eukprot:7391626-Prymnesium_polylepis.2